MLTLGIIREYKVPPDRRVPFSPSQCKTIQSQFPDVRVLVESSPDRIFKDQDYTREGIEVVSSLTECDVIFGIKEVPIDKLIPLKTYLFFSHTIKKQPHNQALLKAILDKKIRLIDYECLKWPVGSRVLGFGRYAGIAGAYEGLRAVGTRYGRFNLPPASVCMDYTGIKSALFREKETIQGMRLKIVVTGSGRVSGGSREILDFLSITCVSPDEFLGKTYDESVFTLLDSPDLYERMDGEPWDHLHFFNNHSLYRSKFKPYTRVADFMINGVFWDNQMPRHFTKEDTADPEFSIKVISDISCDVDGSVPITLHETHSDNPVLGWDRFRQCECHPYLPDSIDVMAISNLPSELPADASRSFGSDLIKHILPLLFEGKNEMIGAATICEQGKLTSNFSYLSDYVS